MHCLPVQRPSGSQEVSAWAAQLLSSAEAAGEQGQQVSHALPALQAAEWLLGGARVGCTAAGRCRVSSDAACATLSLPGLCRVASMRKDKVHNQDCASIFLTNNASLHFANATPDYQARGDLKARAFHIFYRGQQCCAEVRSAWKGSASSCVSTAMICTATAGGICSAPICALCPNSLLARGALCNRPCCSAGRRPHISTEEVS